eukprot:764116-Hanusia_phi.AAC.1
MQSADYHARPIPSATQRLLIPIRHPIQRDVKHKKGIAGRRRNTWHSGPGPARGSGGAPAGPVQGSLPQFHREQNGFVTDRGGPTCSLHLVVHTRRATSANPVRRGKDIGGGGSTRKEGEEIMFEEHCRQQGEERGYVSQRIVIKSPRR